MWRFKMYKARWRDWQLKRYIGLSNRLPVRLRYAVVISEASKYSVNNPTAEVPDITAFDLMKALGSE